MALYSNHPRPVDRVADNTIDPAKDDVLVIGHDSEIDWSDTVPAESPDAVAAELPDQTVWFLHGDVTFEMPVTFADAFQAQRSAYLLLGSDGAAELLTAPCATSEDALFPAPARRVSTGPASGVRRGTIDPTPDPEPADPAVSAARTIMREAHDDLLQQAQAQIEKLAPIVQKHALLRLQEARAEVESEASHYFGTMGTSIPVLLRLAETRSLRPQLAPDLGPLREALLPLQQIKAQIAELEGRRAAAQSAARDPEEKTVLLAERQRRQQEVADTETKLHEARVQLTEAVLGVGEKFPVAWKIWSSAHLDPGDAKDLLVDILSALRDCTDANEDLRRVIEKQPDAVWDYPIVVDQAMNYSLVPQLCIARMAAGERCRDAASGRRRLGEVVMMSGAASMAVMVASSVVAPPVGAAVLVADALLSVADAAAEYFDYVKQSAAFRACLDPRKALAAEPNLASAALVIGLDLLAAASVRGPA